MRRLSGLGTLRRLTSTLRPTLLLAPLLVTLILVTPAPSALTAGGSSPFRAADAAMRARVRNDGLTGGALLVRRGRTTLHQQTFGRWTTARVVPIASASKWLTAATLMTLVDDGKLSLDDPVSDHLPGFGAGKRFVTVRMLLSHTSALQAPGCEGDPSTTLQKCARLVARGPDPAWPPGTEFHYGGVGFVVAGAIIERLSGMSFERTFETRIAGPLGMDHTTFDEGDPTANRNPAPAASAVSSLDDYAKFLAMLAAGGVADGHRVLSAASVAEIERDQVSGIDTRDDGAVQITGIPTYGLGVWRDEVAPDDSIEVVSGSGALGFYPWIDRIHGTSGIVAVADGSGPEHAVPLSQKIARLCWRAAARQR